VIRIKPEKHIKQISEAAFVFDLLFGYIASLKLTGMTTLELDSKIGMFLERTAAKSFLSSKYNYNSHISTGKILCHGIPLETVVIQQDSTVHVDVPLIINDLVSDASWTFISGTGRSELIDLINFSWTLSHSLVDNIKAEMPLHQAAELCMKQVVYSDYYLFNEGMGHGTGYKLHEDPYISYCNKSENSEIFRDGLVFTVEPVILLNNKIGWYENEKKELIFKKANSISCFEFTAAIIKGKCRQISFDENKFKKSIDSPSYF